MKRILFVANVTKEHILKFHVPSIKAFKDSGWEVDVASSGSEPVPYCDHQYAMCWKRSPFTVKTLKGILELRKLINRNGYDVVYCHTPVGGVVGRLASGKARKNGTKVIYFAHGFHFFKGARFVNWALYFPIEKLLSLLTDAIFVSNGEDFRRVQRSFPKKLYTKQFPEVGVDYKRIAVPDPIKVRGEYRDALGFAPDDIVLVYVAELIENKNQIYLLRVLKALVNTRKNIRLLLVGPDHANGYYQREARKMGIEQYVVFTGWRDDIGALLCASDICVASSIREGFGINIVEAMYHHLPIVAVRNRGHEAIIQNGSNGILVSLEDCEQMERAVLRVIEDDALRAHLSDCDVSRFDADTVAKTIVREVEMVIETPKSPKASK